MLEHRAYAHRCKNSLNTLVITQAKTNKLLRAAHLPSDPTLVIGLICLVVFLWLIAAPLLAVFWDMFTSQPGDGHRTHVADGAFTAYYLERAFASRMSEIIFLRPLMNTLTIAVSSTVLALGLGTVLAWLLVRTDMMGRGWLSAALIIPFMLPAWTFALAWTTIFKNAKIGGQPGLASSMGFDAPDWLAYAAVPSIIIMTLNYIPFVIILVGNALRRFDGQLEDAARILGAGPRTAFRLVTIPLMRPAVLSACLLMFADAIGEFSVPYVLGLPVQFETLATSLYRAIGTQQNGMAAVFAGVVMAIGIVTLGIDTWMMRETRRYAIIGGKGTASRETTLGFWRIPAVVSALSVFTLGVILPLGALMLSTVMHVPGRFGAENFTFAYWIGTNLPTPAVPTGILLAPEFWSAAWNTLRIVGIASISAGLLGMVVGYVVVRSPWRTLSVLLRQITFFPYLVPGIAFAAAFLVLFAVPRGPIPALYGTPWILLLALIADQMPFASRAGISSMTQLGREVEDAARMVGAGWLRRMRSIILPINKGALVAGILMPFVSGIKGVSLFIMLAVPSTDVLSTYSLRLVDYNYTQAANAVVLMISAIAVLGTLLINRLTGTGLARGLES